MKARLAILICLFTLSISSCNKLYDNPYDRECPPEVWTPDSLTAVLSSNLIIISWKQTETHFDGFVLERSTDSLNWSPVSSALIDKTARDYADVIIPVSQQLYYRIFAIADQNYSDTCYSTGIRLNGLPTDGLVAYYPFNGNANDESGNGYHGTIHGATLAVDRFGHPNSAYYFNGNSYILSPANTAVPLGNTPRTFSLWLKSNVIDNPANRDIFCWGRFVTSQRFGLVLYNGLPYFCGQHDDYFGTKFIGDDKWHNIIITYDGSTVEIFVDGKFDKSEPKSLNTINSQMIIGRSNLDNSAPTFFDGMIDDIRVYNKVIDDEEIRQLYNEDEYNAIKWSIFNPNLTYGSVSDIDGNNYKTILIGTQTWMAQSLRATKFNDGTVIPSLPVDYTKWELPGYYIWAPEDIPTFGLGYNWYTVNAATNGGKNVCPSGWHVPTDDEWMTLEDYLIYNGYNYDGTIGGADNYAVFGRNKIAKSLGSVSLLWTQATVPGSIGNEDYPEKGNASGFSALPRWAGGSMSIGYYWTSTSALTTLAWDRAIFNCEYGPRREAVDKHEPFSIRCLKD